MTELTQQITSWKYERLRQIAEDKPELINEKEGEWFPLDWALRASNYVAYTFLLRNGAHGSYPILDSRELLVRYVEQLCNEYFSAGWLSGIESSIWEQLFAHRRVFFVGQEPAHGLSEGEKEDLRYLLRQCNIASREQFVELGSES